MKMGGGVGSPYPACPRGRVDQAPTPSLAAIKLSLAYTASSPLVKPRIKSPLTKTLRCVLRGSEKELDGGDRKGGGKGRGVLLAKRDMPVSKRKGSLCRQTCAISVATAAGAGADETSSRAEVHLAEVENGIRLG